MNKPRIFALLTFLVTVYPLHAAEKMSINDFFNEIQGAWQSNQVTFGKPSLTQLNISPALGGTFTHLRYSIIPEGGEGSFLGAAYYQQSEDSSTTATWVSNQGDILPIKAKLELASDSAEKNFSMVSVWGEKGKKLGRTEYRLLIDGRLQLTDWVSHNEEWKQFNQNILTKTSEINDKGTPKVNGIGGLFFRAKNTKESAQWYLDNLGIDLTPSDYGTPPWQQAAGPTVFAPFSQDTDYFGDKSQQWMVNFRVDDLDAIVARLRAAGNKVDVDPENYPNGRFARTLDSEGNPIELWEPKN